jgi:hypothetical protein
MQVVFIDWFLMPAQPFLVPMQMLLSSQIPTNSQLPAPRDPLLLKPRIELGAPRGTKLISFITACCHGLYRTSYEGAHQFRDIASAVMAFPLPMGRG